MEELRKEIVKMVNNADDRKLKIIYHFICKLLGL